VVMLYLSIGKEGHKTCMLVGGMHQVGDGGAAHVLGGIICLSCYVGEASISESAAD
jgi:hypothetical protein